MMKKQHLPIFSPLWSGLFLLLSLVLVIIFKGILDNSSFDNKGFVASKPIHLLASEQNDAKNTHYQNLKPYLEELKIKITDDERNAQGQVTFFLGSKKNIKLKTLISGSALPENYDDLNDAQKKEFDNKITPHYQLFQRFFDSFQNLILSIAKISSQFLNEFNISAVRFPHFQENKKIELDLLLFAKYSRYSKEAINLMQNANLRSQYLTIFLLQNYLNKEEKNFNTFKEELLKTKAQEKYSALWRPLFFFMTEMKNAEIEHIKIKDFTNDRKTITVNLKPIYTLFAPTQKVSREVLLSPQPLVAIWQFAFARTEIDKFWDQGQKKNWTKEQEYGDWFSTLAIEHLDDKYAELWDVFIKGIEILKKLNLQTFNVRIVETNDLYSWNYIVKFILPMWSGTYNKTTEVLSRSLTIETPSKTTPGTSSTVDYCQYFGYKSSTTSSINPCSAGFIVNNERWKNLINALGKNPAFSAETQKHIDQSVFFANWKLLYLDLTKIHFKQIDSSASQEWKLATTQGNIILKNKGGFELKWQTRPKIKNAIATIVVHPSYNKRFRRWFFPLKVFRDFLKIAKFWQKNNIFDNQHLAEFLSSFPFFDDLIKQFDKLKILKINHLVIDAKKGISLQFEQLQNIAFSGTNKLGMEFFQNLVNLYAKPEQLKRLLKLIADQIDFLLLPAWTVLKTYLPKLKTKKITTVFINDQRMDLTSLFADAKVGKSSQLSTDAFKNLVLLKGYSQDFLNNWLQNILSAKKKSESWTTLFQKDIIFWTVIVAVLILVFTLWIIYVRNIIKKHNV